MKTTLKMLVPAWIVLLTVSDVLFAQANNEVLGAYVLQNKTPAQLEKDFRSKATVLVDASRDLLDLDEDQVNKLRLACMGDISRFMQDLVELDLHTKNFRMQDLAQNQDEMQWLWPMVMPARQQIERGLHGSTSLFHKALQSQLSQEQQKEYEANEQATLHRKTVAVTKLTLIEIEKKMPLTKKQRDRILELVEQSGKPKTIDDSMSYYLGLMVLARLPKEKLGEILTNDQLKLFQRLTAVAQQLGGVGW